MDNRDNRPGCCRTNRSSAPQNTNMGCGSLMQQLQSVDFAIVELTLYLDSYPTCCEARRMLDQLIEQRKPIADAYEAEFGPLTAACKKSSGWDWVNGPWPWELAFPGNDARRR